MGEVGLPFKTANFTVTKCCQFIFTALTLTIFSTRAMRFVYVDVQCRKCQANVPSTAK